MTSVNSYRRTKGLGDVPTNNCLCQTADRHTQQLVAGQASKHDWASCRYAGNGNCMWNKPKEICGYPRRGYENWAGFPGSGGQMNAKIALNLWKNSQGHNTVIINSGKWRNKNWKGMGASVRGNQAVLWFGD